MGSTVLHGEFTLDIGITLEVHECGTCGVAFGIGAGFAHARRNDHQAWCCPNGHRWSYSGESTEERLIRERNEARERLAREKAHHDQTEARLRATKGVVTKQRKRLDRVKHGVCPCCNRHFDNVEAHMATEHPEFDPASLEAESETARRG